MRRAVIGALVAKDTTPIDILDVLSEYAAHLTDASPMQRLEEVEDKIAIAELQPYRV